VRRAVGAVQLYRATGRTEQVALQHPGPRMSEYLSPERIDF
jgi:hypothetical protein